MKKAAKMILIRQFTAPVSTLFFVCLFLSVATCNQISADSSIYDILDLYGLPMGLLPKGVSNFSIDTSGKFQVYLDQACNAKFENELHYEMNVSGVLSYGKIDGLSGMTAQDLFLWFPVIEIRVDIPSSGLIYFDVGVVSKKFSLSLFETPRDCLAVPSFDLQNERNTLGKVSKHNLTVWEELWGTQKSFSVKEMEEMMIHKTSDMRNQDGEFYGFYFVKDKNGKH